MAICSAVVRSLLLIKVGEYFDISCKPDYLLDNVDAVMDEYKELKYSVAVQPPPLINCGLKPFLRVTRTA